MTTFAALSAVLVAGVVTYATRAGLILFLAERPLPPNITRALRYVGPAVLAALTVNLVAGGRGIDGIEGAELIAVGVGVVAAIAVRNLVVALAAGMIALWIATWLL